MGSGSGQTVGVIGAGGSGILAGTYLRRCEIPFELLEARDGVGGTWHYDPDGDGSAAYDSLLMNTTKLASSPAAMRVPGRPWHYAERAEMKRYLKRLVDREGLREHIRLGWRVSKATPCAEIIAAHRQLHSRSARADDRNVREALAQLTSSASPSV